MRGNDICSSTIIDIKVLESYLNEEHYWAFDKIKGVGSICKVKKLHNGENPIDPDVVSIGPYHHGKKTLQAMEQIKWNWMDCILKINRKTTLRDYVKSLKEVEHIARNYYIDKIAMESNEFINMLLLDGLFILVLVCAIELNRDMNDSIPDQEDSNNKIKPLQLGFAVHDIFIVDNQIPFFVLEIIYGLFIGEEKAVPLLGEIISYYIEQIILGRFPKYIKETNRPRNVHHLLHLYHAYLRPSRNFDSHFVQLDPIEGQDQIVKCWHRALQYHIVGIKFEKRKFSENNPHSLLDVKFIDNMLEIPYLRIDGNTLSIFKNLVAFEKANPKFGNDITAYIIFMSQLVEDARDVALLVSKGIVEHNLRDEEEVVDLFMRLREGTTFDFMGNFYLRNICHNLEAYYQSCMKRWNVWFRRTALAVVHGTSRYLIGKD